MIHIKQSTQYYINERSVTFSENDLESPNRIAVSVASGTVIMVHVPGTIDYASDGNYEKWLLKGYPTRVASNDKHYIYARLGRETQSALVVFSVNDYTIEGEILTGNIDSDGNAETNGTPSEEYYFVKIGELTATDGTSDRELTYDSGLLGTAKGDHEADTALEEMFELDKTSTPWLIKVKQFFHEFTVKKAITLLGSFIFGNRTLTGVATSEEAMAGETPSDEDIATAGYVKKFTDGKYIKKYEPDSTDYALTFNKEARWGNFVTGVSGGYIDKEGYLEMEEGVFRKRLFVPEIAYNRVTYFRGRMVLSPGGGCTVKEFADNGDGSFTITPDLTEAEGLSQFVDDILTTYHNYQDADGNFQGFTEMKFRVTAADYDAKTFVVVPKVAGDAPAVSMVLAQTGNFTDTERQTYTLFDSVLGNNCITWFDNANTWDTEPAQESAWIGKKRGRVIDGIETSGYNAVLRNIIMTGKIFQVDDISGADIRVPIDKGDYADGQQYAYYDRVSHQGALWLCIAEAGTTATPADNSTDWLKQVSEGAAGANGTDGTSASYLGQWQSGMTVPRLGMVMMAGNTYIAKVETTNPPLWTLTDQDGNRLLQTQDGGKTYGYILTGEANTDEYDLLIAAPKDGADGAAGANAITADLDNEMDSVSLTAEGLTTAESTFNLKVSMWNGATALALSKIALTLPANVTGTYNVSTGSVTIKVARGVALADSNPVVITASAVVEGVTFSRTLTFALAAVKAGADAIIYSIEPSVLAVKKDAAGNYSVSTVSCAQYKQTGSGARSLTTDGVIKYALDGGAEQTFTAAIATTAFVKTLTFLLYVGGVLVDKETVPLVVDGTDGQSVVAAGQWQTAATPYPMNTIVRMGGRSWLSLSKTSNPPLWTLTDQDGNRLLQTQDGGKTYGYILTGEENTTEWQLVAEDGSDGTNGTDGADGVSYSIVCDTSCINVGASGTLSPSGFVAYAKRTVGSTVASYNGAYLAARAYQNGSWVQVVAPVRAASITVSASGAYTGYSVRLYAGQSDAAAWNSAFMAEHSVALTFDGAKGDRGIMPRYRGVWSAAEEYVYNTEVQDIVIHQFGNRFITFRVKNQGATLKGTAPTSETGDSNWESAQQFSFIAAGLVLAEKGKINNLYVDTVEATNSDGTVTTSIDGSTGKLTAKSAEIHGDLKAKTISLEIASKYEGGKVNDGAFIIDEPNILPELPEGETQVVEWATPILTRVLLETTLRGVNSNVRIAPNGDVLSSSTTLKISGYNGKYYRLIGYHETGEIYTYWLIYQLSLTAFS